MILKSKKKRIRTYLEEKQSSGGFSAFEHLLCDYLDGTMKRRLIEAVLKTPVIYIDWNPNHRCIDIQARYKKLLVELQIEQNFFSIGIDPDEPDEHCEYTLETKEQVYTHLIASLV